MLTINVSDSSKCFTHFNSSRWSRDYNYHCHLQMGNQGQERPSNLPKVAARLSGSGLWALCHDALLDRCDQSQMTQWGREWEGGRQWYVWYVREMGEEGEPNHRRRSPCFSLLFPLYEFNAEFLWKLLQNTSPNIFSLKAILLKWFLMSKYSCFANRAPFPLGPGPLVCWSFPNG